MQRAVMAGGKCLDVGDRWERSKLMARILEDQDAPGSPPWPSVSGLLALCGLMTPHGIASAQEERDEKTLQEVHEIVKKIQARVRKDQRLTG